jgi:hypothetical protein
MDISKAKPRWIRLITSDGGYRVPHGKGLIVLGGAVRHITAVDSILYIGIVDSLTPESAHNVRLILVAAATASGIFPIFNTLADQGQIQFSPMILLEGYTLVFGGNTLSDAVINILEFDV